MNPSLQTIRVISEGRPGHENQSVGLAQAIARRTNAAVEIIRIPATWNLLGRRRAACESRGQSPQLVIGTGHKTHLPLWFAARKFQARSVVIMEPTWPKFLFDLCILPQHDLEGPATSSRVISTLGALNRLPETKPMKRAQGVILIGGPSKSHGWDAEATAVAIQSVLASQSSLVWTIANSRRTPAGFLEQLKSRGIKAELVPYEKTTPEWLPTQLMAAQEVWATEDSVSMLFEAVTAGARVGVLPAPVTKPKADPVLAVQKLIQEGYATHFQLWSNNGRQLPTPRPLHETGRCADLVLARLFPGIRPV